MLNVMDKTKFEKALTGFDLNTLEESKDIIYALSKGFRIIYYNPACLTFAKENGSDETMLEKYSVIPITKAIPQVFRNYYVTKYKEVLLTGKVSKLDYECSSADTYRLFNQIIYPFKNGKGILVVNRTRIELPMSQIYRNSKKALENMYMHETGFINQCCNCRCVQNVEDKENWDWVPEWVKNMHPKTSHTICNVCYDYYWKYYKVKFSTTAM
jgi:hypothetical protein